MALAVTDDPTEAPEPPKAGEVFTRRWVVEMILDLAGYTAEADLGAGVAIEPSCGAGAFLVPMVERLIESCQLHGRKIAEADGAIRAFDLLPRNVELARKAVAGVLVRADSLQDDADRLAQGWVSQADFLDPSVLVPEGTWVLGNPPYIRPEEIDDATLVAYRAAWSTMRGRSDIYVGFIERALTTLAPMGVVGFIVADRWMRNQYGAGLRSLIAERFSVEAVVQMHEVDAFERPVNAYPAVTVIRREKQRKAILADTTKQFDGRAAQGLVDWAQTTRKAIERKSYGAARLGGWFSGDTLWPMGTPAQLALVDSLERRFPPLQDSETGTTIGIGVATGADAVFITRHPTLVEEERLLPLIMGPQITSGQVNWTDSPTYLVNPWDEDGLVDLHEYPRLADYLRRHAGKLRLRHIAKKQPGRWYKTIDRVSTTLAGKPKLLLPDLKAVIHPVLDPGGEDGLYPHHNLYWVTSTGWDIEVLGGLLLSDIANLFVGTYCVKMASGCYRFQAQYLRRIRVPAKDSLSDADQRTLASAFNDRDVERASGIARRLYGIT